MKNLYILLGAFVLLTTIGGAEAGFNITATDNYTGGSINNFQSLVKKDYFVDLSSIDSGNWVGTNNVRSVFAYNQSQIYFGIDGGNLAVLNINNETVINVTSSAPLNWTSGAEIYSIFAFNSTAVYTGMNSGRFGVYNPVTNVWTDLSATDPGNWVNVRQVLSVFAFNSTAVYTGITQDRFGVYNPVTNVWTDKTFSGLSSTRGIFAFNSTHIYLAGTGGVFIYNSLNDSFFNTDVIYNLTSASQTPIFAFNSTAVYTGLGSGRFGVYNPVTNVWTDLSATDPGNWAGGFTVNSIFAYNSTAVYTGLTGGRFGVYNPVTNVWTDLSATDPGNWVGTDNLNQISGLDETIYVSLSNGKIGAYNYRALLSTQNGTINSLITTNSTLNSNITINSPNYFPVSFTNYSSSSLSASLFQHEVGFTATEIVSGLPVGGDFTVCAPLQCATGTNPVLYLAAGTYNLTFNKTGWYNLTFQYTAAPLVSTTHNIDGAHRYRLNITLRNSGNNTLDPSFKLNVTSINYNYSILVNGTNLGTTIPWNNDTFIMKAYDATFVAAANQTNTTTNFLSTPVLANYTIQSFFTNSFIIEFRNEKTGAIVNGTTINAFLTGTIISYNYTTTNGKINATLLAPQRYIITYGGSPFAQREYIVNLTNQTFQTLTLWLLENSSGTYVRFSVLDSSYQTLQGAVINAQKKNLSGTNYYTVQDCETDSNGECILFLETLTTTYRFITQYRDVVRVSGDTVLSRDTYTIVLNTGSSTLQQVIGRTDVQAGLLFTAPGTFTYIVNDASNNVVSGELVVQRRFGGRLYPVQTVSSSGNSFTLQITGVNTSLGDEIVATGYVFVNGEPVPTHQVSVIDSPAGSALGSSMVFLFLGMAFTIVFIFAWNPVAPLVAFGAFIIIASRIGLVAFGAPALISILIVIAIAIYRMRSV